MHKPEGQQQAGEDLEAKFIQFVVSRATAHKRVHDYTCCIPYVEPMVSQRQYRKCNIGLFYKISAVYTIFV